MQYRTFGNTNLNVSEIGFGAWGIGGDKGKIPAYGSTNDTVSIDAIKTAIDQGINFIDTSNIYGNGHSEFIIGKAVQGQRDKIILATKFGFESNSISQDFSIDALERSLLQSLKRLRMDFVDIVQFHSPDPSLFVHNQELLDFIHRIKSVGISKFVGISVKQPSDALTIFQTYIPDCIQFNFNILDQRVLDCNLLEHCSRLRVGTIARTPLAFGFLTGKINSFQFHKNDHRHRFSQEQIKIWIDGAAQSENALKEIDGSMTQKAINYCLSNRAISCVIPGMITPSEVIENCHSSTLPILTSDAIDRLRNIYINNRLFI